MRSMSVKHFFSKYEKGTKTADVATIMVDSNDKIHISSS